MNLAVTLALTSAALSVYVAAMSHRFSLAAGWSDQRWFSLVACSVAAYSAINLPELTSESPPVVLACFRVQFALAFVHVACWWRYAAAYLDHPDRPLQRWAFWAMLAIGLSGLVPGVVYTDVVRFHTFEPLRVVYRDPSPTLFGSLALGVIPLLLGRVAVQFAAAARRGFSHASTHACALGLYLVFVVNDARTAGHVVSMPYLVDSGGFAIPIAMVGYVLTARFVAQSQRLASAEKLAAVGALAAGVAHEINNPLTYVFNNLEYAWRLVRARGGDGGRGDQNLLGALTEARGRSGCGSSSAT